jgi:acetyltransferase-like isoleucine patch superfamily enzyme
VKPIISGNIRIRHPEHFIVGQDSIIDDFSYFSTKVRVGRCSHIASGCTVGGGCAYEFSLGDFCSVSAGVRIWCTSDDFVNDLVTIIPPDIDTVKTHLITGNVRMENFTAVGVNSVVLPDNVIPEGTVIGAMSLVPAHFGFEPWSVYAGIPVKRLRSRNREAVSDQAARLRRMLDERRGDKEEDR